MISVKLRVILLTIFFLCATSIVSALPMVPAEYYGTVYIDGSPAPAGTNITSVIENQVTDFFVTTVPGVFGGTGPMDPRLSVTGTADGQKISFTINGILANQTAVFHSGTTGQIALSLGVTSVVTPVPNATTTLPQGAIVYPDLGTSGSYDSPSQYGQSSRSGTGESAPMNPSNRILAPASEMSPVLTTPTTAAIPAAQPASSEERSEIPATLAGEIPQTRPPTTSAPGYSAVTFAGLVVVCIGYRIVRSCL